MSTREDLRELARIHADQDASDFPTDDQYNILLKFAGKRVWLDLFRAGFPADFNSSNIVSNGASKYNLGIPLGDSLVSVTGVFAQQGQERFELKRLREGDRAQLLSLNSSTGISIYYSITYSALAGTVIELLPKSSGITYTVNYIQGFDDFSDDNADWTGPFGSDELVALRAAITAMRKEGDGRRAEALVKEQEYKDILQTVLDTVTRLDGRNAATIRDVMNGSFNRNSFDYNADGFTGSLYG